MEEALRWPAISLSNLSDFEWWWYDDGQHHARYKK